ncbi:MAG: hypothetical protein FJ040_07405 [Chloroflexi bacterium]|nr:hypothetical protein [Chloroflexota bacterium]
MKAAARVMWQQATQMVIDAAGDERIYAEWVENLASHDVRVQVPAIWALQQAGPAVIPVLVAGLQNSQTRIRRNCVDVIDHGGYGADARCVTGLLPLLHDSVAHIRKAVWHTLFCERCVAPSHCEIVAPALDEYTLLSTIGIHDPNPKLQAQLMQRWRVLHSQRGA